VHAAPETVLIKPVAQALETWPAGATIEWNGLKL
jgi:hypothetical protein